MSERNDDIPMVPEHKAESMLMHMGRANRNMMIVVISVCIAMVVMAMIFVTGYTSRTKDWLNTLAGMQKNSAVTEVTNGQQADP